MAIPALLDRASVRLPSRHGPLARQISPDKNMNFPCTTAAFTLSPAPGGLRHLVLTRPGTEPSMRFLSVGSHLCARASSRQPLTGMPLPSASSCFRPFGGHLRYSYRGLSPHQFMPVPGVPQRCSQPATPAADLKCYLKITSKLPTPIPCITLSASHEGAMYEHYHGKTPAGH